MLRAPLVAAVAFAVSLAAPAVASKDARIEVRSPQPGASVNLQSQPIASTVRSVIVDVTGGLGKTTVVAEGGVRKGAGAGSATGDAVAACWLIGPEAIPVNNDKIRKMLATDPDIRAIQRSPSPQTILAHCMALVRGLGTFLATSSSTTRGARAAAAGCSVKPVALRYKRSAGKTTVVLSTSSATRPKVSYSCRRAGGGVRITARRRGGGSIAEEVGSQLGVGLYKARDAPAAATRSLTVGFGLRP